MSSKKRTATQARKDRALLKRLRKSGTYSGKIDLRKAPSRYQLQKLQQLAAKTKAGKRKMPPKQKSPGAKITRKVLSEKQVRGLKPGEKTSKLTTYALPFLRKGHVEPEWRRFTKKQLHEFLYNGPSGELLAPDQRHEWSSYAVRETWTFETRDTRDQFKTDVDVYFSGQRVSEPHGGVPERRPLNTKTKARRK